MLHTFNKLQGCIDYFIICIIPVCFVARYSHGSAREMTFKSVVCGAVPVCSGAGECVSLTASSRYSLGSYSCGYITVNNKIVLTCRACKLVINIMF